MNERIQRLNARITRGVVPAMATPLTESAGNVNSSALPDLVAFLIGKGVKGLFVGGTTGEGILLDTNQRKILHEQTIQAANGQIPVLVHVGTNITADSIELAQHAALSGASAIVCVTPYFYGLSESAILNHFKAVAAAAPETPFFAYDIPQMAVNGVTPTLLLLLGNEIPTFAGVKCSRTDAQMIRQLVDAAPANTVVLAGNERIALGSLALGVHGLISGLATAVPEPFVRLTKSFFDGDAQDALQQQKLINQILDLTPGGGRIGFLKALLIQRGIDAGSALPPRPNPENVEQLWAQIERLLAMFAA